MLDNDLFVRSVALIKKWGGARLSSGLTLSDALTVGKVSLWEVVSPFLALYRFPEFILQKGSGRRQPLRGRMAEAVRPYRGMLGRVRDDFCFAVRRSADDCLRWNELSPYVLFLSYWPLFYRETFRAAAEYLADNNIVSTVALFGNETFPEKPSRPLIHFHSTLKHAIPSVIDRTKEYQSHLRRIKRELLREFRQIVEPDLPGEWGSVKRELDWLFWSLFPRLARDVAIAEHIMNDHRPDMVVSPDDSDRARIYTILAHAAGIPSLIVQQGLLNEKAVEWRFCTADRIAAIGPSSVRELCAHGLDAGRIELTGCPRYDVLCRSSAEEREGIRKSMGIRAESRMVLLASQPCVYGAFSSPSARAKMLQAMGRTAASLESVHLVVKAHPTEDIRELQRLIGHQGQVLYVEPSADIQKLIVACDVFVTFFSTSALQALIASKPVVTLCFQGSGVKGFYVGNEALFAARSESELAAHINALAGSERNRVLARREDARKKLVYDLTYLPDGQASARLAGLIKKSGIDKSKGFRV